MSICKITLNKHDKLQLKISASSNLKKTDLWFFFLPISKINFFTAV